VDEGAEEPAGNLNTPPLLLLLLLLLLALAPAPAPALAAPGAGWLLPG
jgi:hypothetical protein